MKAAKKSGNRTVYTKIILSFSRKLRYDYVTSFSGNAALFLLMSLFPMLMYLISIFSYLPIENANYSQYILEIFPNSLQGFIEELIQEANIESASVLQSFAMIGTLVCASKGVYAIIIGMNAVYGIRETRNFILLNILAVVYVVAFFGLIGVSIVLIVLGDKIFNELLRFIPGLTKFQSMFSNGKYIATMLIIMILLLLIYLFIPNRKTKIKYEFIGAAFASIAVVGFSEIFSYYIDHFAHYSVTYGSLATIVIFILWLYTSMYLVFIGAEINVVIRTYMEYGYNYNMAYEYYNNEYEGDLEDDKALLVRLAKKRDDMGRKTK